MNAVNDDALTSYQAHNRKRNRIVWKRMAIQTTVIIVHVMLIKVAIPNVMWALIGLLFWGGLVLAAVRSGRWVCATFCWLGGIQDLMYRWAKKRVGFSPKVTQWAVLVLLVAWVPLAWVLVDGTMLSDKGVPINNPFESGDNPLAQAGHFLILLIVGLSVTVFGQRGGCHYFCPFGMVVTYSRNRRLKK
ncbi:MAG: 4Fe-4S binding protein [Chlorobiales bacterium]|nr:4Fe-4S binding protein [Chlorobiales bacterium]